MGNGWPPPVLSNEDYNIIKGGTLITSGPNSGCVQVGDNFFWVENKGTIWYLHSDAVDEELISYIPEDVWERCKEEGAYTWIARSECWRDDGHDYRWQGQPEDDIYLEEI